jgi:hypothetical protein
VEPCTATASSTTSLNAPAGCIDQGFQNLCTFTVHDAARRGKGPLHPLYGRERVRKQNRNSFARLLYQDSVSRRNRSMTGGCIITERTLISACVNG